LKKTLAQLRDPGSIRTQRIPGLEAELRAYQVTGVNWLRFMTSLQLGACLADDMGLGKTVQVLALLLQLRAVDKRKAVNRKTKAVASLLIVPASLLANWQAEAARFSPSLKLVMLHPSETGIDLKNSRAITCAVANADLVITTYGMLSRLPALAKLTWRLAVLDEAQAIRTPGTRQRKPVRQLNAGARIALTGTAVENSLADLWSLFDFLNPGLLGNASEFKRLVKRLQADEQADYSPLRQLVSPYILRRLKTDKQVIDDLPDKTEVKRYCSLSKMQARLYQASVRELSRQLAEADGMQRRGLVLAYLMRFKQICNHPAQWQGTGDYKVSNSGKLQQLVSLCEELAERQERLLVFTQFREMTEPLAHVLAQVFGQSGLVLHGGTSIKRRQAMVDSFQQTDGPPFFVLSLKAGGTGLNLTAASQVVHFDRWWNPAVENQATDRAFRIGQKRNVLVHKFVCRGTVEERIDALISEKTTLADAVLNTDGGKLLTEMNDAELMDFVALDLNTAVDAQ
jgi:non-specific serine/threonine protein kinase